MLPDPDHAEELDPEQMAKWVALPPDQRPRIIDCREKEEQDICQIAGNEWLPLGSFPTSLEFLKSGNERGVVVYCHHGMRSLRATHFLRAHGISNAFSLRGGIDVWSTTIDSQIPRY